MTPVPHVEDVSAPITGTTRVYPPVTVVVPTHNREAVLGQTLDSVLGQRDVETKVVVVDDASTPSTAEVLARYPAVTSIRNTSPVEQRQARNDGAALADTEWIAFCDDDDLWAPWKLRRQLDAAFDAQADWVACSSLAIDEFCTPLSGQLVGDPVDMVRRLPRQNVIPGGGSGVLMRRDLFTAVGGFRLDAKYVEDWDLWVRLSRSGTLACVDELLVAQRQWPSSYSHQSLHAQRQAFTDMVARYAGGSAGSFRNRPRHVGSFELQRRLSGHRRRDLVAHVPRIVVQSPEDWKFVAAVLLLPDARLAQMRLRSVAGQDMDTVLSWLRAVGGASQCQDAVR